jgi:hypothetical protein
MCQWTTTVAARSQVLKLWRGGDDIVGRQRAADALQRELSNCLDLGRSQPTATIRLMRWRLFRKLLLNNRNDLRED